MAKKDSSRGKKLCLMLIAVLACAAVLSVRSFTAAEVGLESRLVVTEPARSLIATKNFSLRDGKAFLNGRAESRIERVVTLNPDGSIQSDSSRERVPGRFSIQNNMAQSITVEIEAEGREDWPGDVEVYLDPCRADLSAGALQDFCLTVEDKAVPEEDEVIEFTIPLGIEANWENGSADLMVFVPARVMRSYTEVVIPPPQAEAEENVLEPAGLGGDQEAAGDALPESGETVETAGDKGGDRTEGGALPEQRVSEQEEGKETRPPED